MQKVNPNSSESFYDLIKMFSYNKDLSLDIKNKSIEYKNDIAINDVSYSGLAEKRIDAYMIKPSGEGPFPSIIFVHPAPGSRDTFLDEAIAMAEIGAMSLVIEAPWAHTEFVQKY
jgi:dipeptidyl aminopeptidase/acylaminoacyl peptidase